MIIDIRQEAQEEITGIKFDDSPDYITCNGIAGSVRLKQKGRNIILCNTVDIDNLIKALQKAKELWG